MNFLNNLIRIASALCICFSCIGIFGFVIYFLYDMAFGMTLGLSGMAISSLFQALRLWEKDRVRGFLMLVTAGFLFGAIFFL